MSTINVYVVFSGLDVPYKSNESEVLKVFSTYKKAYDYLLGWVKDANRKATEWNTKYPHLRTRKMYREATPNRGELCLFELSDHSIESYYIEKYEVN